MAGGSIKKNYIYNVSFQIFTLLTPLITTPYVSRVLQPEGVGTFNYIHSIATYFALLAALGLTSYGLREMSRIRDDKRLVSRLFWELTIIRVVTTLLSVLLYCGFIAVTGSDWRLYLATGFTILAVGVDFSWFYQAMENFKALAIRNFAIKILTVLCVFIFVRTKDDLIVYTVIQTGGVFLSNLLLVPYLKKWLIPIKWRRMQFVRHVKESLVYFVTTIATSVYTVLDVTMIGIITRDMAQNGYYGQAHKIVKILLTVITSLTVVVGVRTSYLFGQNREEEIRQHIRDTFRFMYMISFPMCAGLLACSNLFAPEFFGTDYTAVGPMMMLFSPLLFIIGISNVLGSLYLTPSGQRGKSNQAILIGAGSNLVMNLILIPQLGAMGAVIASVLAELIISALYLRYSHAFISAWQLIGMAGRYVLYSALMFVPIYLLGQVLPARATTILVQIGAGVVIYATLLILFRDPAWLVCKKALAKKLKRPTPVEEQTNESF